MTKEEFDIRKKQQYIVTEEDVMEATAKMMGEKDGPVAGLIEVSPVLALMIPVISIEVWKNIIEKKQAEAQDQVTDMMAAILAANKEDK